MKTCIAFTATAVFIATTFDSVTGLAKYLNELPNGSSFSQELGHPDNDSSQLTDFAKAFEAAGHSWTADLCNQSFPGSSMTNGEAFGDPCCTWTKGGTADFTVTAFTTTPTKATTCSSTASSTASSTTDSSTTSAPSMTAAAPSSAYTEAPTPTTAAPVTPAPAYTNAPTTTPSTGAPQTQSPSSGGCAVKADEGTKQGSSYRRFRH
ncbi:unnamed protein product [Phytophthora fragariaefolia]|uniref:Unnamed protein product n=1 Tax=Phytophthora fragariaefolia TaxID=1490495 RepID=A0A9W6YKX9_9STRA|nr:unnamed protein product [Phytophthora fragariaefolia]